MTSSRFCIIRNISIFIAIFPFYDIRWFQFPGVFSMHTPCALLRTLWKLMKLCFNDGFLLDYKLVLATAAQTAAANWLLALQALVSVAWRLSETADAERYEQVYAAFEVAVYTEFSSHASVCTG